MSLFTCYSTCHIKFQAFNYLHDVAKVPRLPLANYAAKTVLADTSQCFLLNNNYEEIIVMRILKGPNRV